MSCTLQMFNDNTQKNLILRKQCKQLNDHWTCETMNNLSYTSLFGFLIRHVDVNGRCQARFPLSIILKVTRGNEVVGIQKHILYIISYKLPWVLRQKILVTIWNSPSLFFIGASSLSALFQCISYM